MLVDFHSVTKLYSSGEGIRNLSFSLPPGQVVGLLGLNGSGKTTTLKIISGLLKPQSGSVTVVGCTSKKGRSQVAFLGDRQGFPLWMTPNDMTRFMATFYEDFSIDRFQSLVKQLAIPQTPLGEMSKGQQQKIKLTATMARQSKLYLLDEPLSGIDLVARTGILETLIANWPSESSIMIATHEIRDVDPFLNRAIFLKSGHKVADDDLAQIRARGSNTSERYMQLMGDHHD